MGKPSKIFVCGLKGIGKTTLLEQLIYNNLNRQDIHPTIEDIYVATVETDRGTREVLRFYDTEGFGFSDGAEITLPKQFFTIADAFVLIYSVDNRQSFEVVDILKRDIDKNKEKREIITIVIGLTGREDKRQREVDPLYVSGWSAREKVKHFDCCVADRQTLFPPFVFLASKLSLPPAKTTFAPLGMVSRKPKEAVAHTKY